MNLRRIICVCAMAALGMSLLAGSTVGQKCRSKEQLLGSWTLVHMGSVCPDGSGHRRLCHPEGITLFDACGQYIITAMCSDRAKYTMNNVPQFFAQGGLGR